MKIDDIYKKLKNTSYNYYCDDKYSNPFNDRIGLNCSDSNVADKIIGKVIRERCVRKATPEEIEWIKNQPHVDLSKPENESLKKIIIKLYEMGVFNEEDNLR